MKLSHSPVLLCLIFLLPLVSCGQSDSDNKGAGTEDAVEEGLSAADLGDTIMKTYRDAIGDVVKLTNGLPPGEKIYDDAVALKEKYVQKFVALGRQRAAMSDADRASIDSKLRLGMSNFYSDPAYTAYLEATNGYMTTDRKLHEILADFNVITQYSDFELLKKQEPEEAKRLGV